MNCWWPGPSGVRSTRESWPAQGLAGPSALAGATSNGRSQDTRVASAVAATSQTEGSSVTGKSFMSPNVWSLAHRSAPA